MTSPPGRPSVQFELDPNTAGKRPDQLVSLLRRTLQQEFPDEIEQIEVTFLPETAVVSVTASETLEEKAAARILRRAQSVFNEFVTSPWY